MRRHQNLLPKGSVRQHEGHLVTDRHQINSLADCDDNTSPFASGGERELRPNLVEPLGDEEIREVHAGCPYVDERLAGTGLRHGDIMMDAMRPDRPELFDEQRTHGSGPPGA